MSKPDNDFEDIGVLDGVDDPWSEAEFDPDSQAEGGAVDDASELGEAVIKGKSNNSKSIIKLLLLVSALGGAAYVAFPLLSKNNNNNLPIIKISSDHIVDDTSIQQPVLLDDVVELGGNTPVVDSLYGDGAGEFANVSNNVEVDEHVDVLTPMPDEFNADNIELADLNPLVVVQDIIENIEPVILVEDDLLSETESVFEAEVVVSVIEKEQIVFFEGDSSLGNDVINLEESPELNNIEMEAIDSINPISLDTIVEPKVEVIEPKVEVIKNKLLRKPSVDHKKVNWVIRAAQSGSAVIYDKNSNEMKTVEVNNIVSGIGRIKSIEVVDGKWLIIGALGTIRQ